MMLQRLLFQYILIYNYIEYGYDINIDPWGFIIFKDGL